jgi:alpha-galactosidase
VIEEYKIDLFRLDYNLGKHDLQNRYRGANGEENAFLRYYRNTLAMYGRLRRKYPDIVFENCAGGGGRTDVAFVRNFSHTWVSDHNVAPRSFSITNGMTMALPPELVDRLASGMGCHTMAALSWQIRNTIFGRPTTNDYNAVGSEMNPAQLEIVKHTLDIYKKHVRPYIDESVIFHHTPELVGDPTSSGAIVDQPRGTGILERASEDARHGVIGVFSLADTGRGAVEVVYPKGIDPSLSYTVTLDNSGASYTVSGSDLMQNGIRVTLPTALSSELIIYEAC